jgi:hypothetical protein
MNSIEYEGVPPDWVADVERIVAAVEAHPWGGQSFDLLVHGDLPTLLEKYMPADRFFRWKRGYEEGVRMTMTIGMTFKADDGRHAAAVGDVPDRGTFLMFAGHEAVEAALIRRGQAEGHQFEDGTHTGISHILWDEYVAERARRQIFDALDLGYCALDNGFVCSQVEDLEAELPELLEWAVANDDVPQRLYQHWYEIAHVYAMSLGRADEGSRADVPELRKFRQLELIQESGSGWAALDDALRCVFDQPTTAVNDLDQLVRNRGWMEVYEGLGRIWNPRYEAALG